MPVMHFSCSSVPTNAEPAIELLRFLLQRQNQRRIEIIEVPATPARTPATIGVFDEPLLELDDSGVGTADEGATGSVTVAVLPKGEV
jgi:hypothetical protein